MSEPKKNVQYVAANGTFTLAGMLLIIALLDRIKDLESRVTALEP